MFVCRWGGVARPLQPVQTETKRQGGKADGAQKRQGRPGGRDENNVVLTTMNSLKLKDSKDGEKKCETHGD